MRKKKFSIASAAALGLLLAGVLMAANVQAQTQAPSQQVQARVVSANQVTGADGRLGYDVTYEYNGRNYNTRTDSHPGATIAVEVSPYGVATMPVAPQTQFGFAPAAAGRSPWDDVVPEQGVVVSAGRPAPAPTYYAPPVYGAPVYAAPVYVQPAYGYGYGYAPYAYPPIGLSLNLGYSRGWGGRGGRWR